MPEAGSPQHARVLQYRELLDALPMDAYTHGCILHPELTTDSMIPKYATAEIRSEYLGRGAPAPQLSPFLASPWDSSLRLLLLPLESLALLFLPSFSLPVSASLFLSP